MCTLPGTPLKDCWVRKISNLYDILASDVFSLFVLTALILCRRALAFVLFGLDYAEFDFSKYKTIVTCHTKR